MSMNEKMHPVAYSAFVPTIHSLSILVNLYTLSYINYSALRERRPVQILILLTIIFTSFAVISKLISHLPDCQGPVEEDDIRVCSKVADLIFSLFDGLMAITTSYSYVMRLQCMLPSREKLLRLFAIIPSLYPFTNIPRILTKSIGIVDGKDEITATEVSKKIFFIASIALALNQTAMHVLLIHQLLSTKSMIHSRLSKFTIEKFVLIACMIVNFACIIGASFYLYAQQFAAVALLYLFLAFDFLIFCKVNQLIARAMKEPVGGEMATSFVPQDLTEAKEVNDISQV